MKKICSKIVYPAATLFFLLFIMTTLHPFLAINKPVNGDILVIEGWLPEYALEKAKKIYDGGNYRLIAIAGIADKDPSSENSLDPAAAFFVGAGIKREKILVASAPYTKENKTRSYAAELKKRMEIENDTFRRIDVLTLGAHGRKSYAVFKKLFEPDIKVGIISIEPETYNSRFWWLSAEGWQWVVLDLAKYLAEVTDFSSQPVHEE